MTNFNHFLTEKHAIKRNYFLHNPFPKFHLFEKIFFALNLGIFTEKTSCCINCLKVCRRKRRCFKTVKIFWYKCNFNAPGKLTFSVFWKVLQLSSTPQVFLQFTIAGQFTSYACISPWFYKYMWLNDSNVLISLGTILSSEIQFWNLTGRRTFELWFVWSFPVTEQWLDSTIFVTF